MIIEIDVKNGNYILSIISERNGKGITRRYRNQEKIRKIIESLKREQIKYTRKSRDLRIHYEDVLVILKDINNIVKKAKYKDILINIEKRNTINVNYANQRRLAALGLSIVFVSASSIFSLNKSTVVVPTMPKNSVTFEDNSLNKKSFMDILQNRDFEISYDTFDERIEQTKYAFNQDLMICSNMTEYTLNKMTKFYNEHKDEIMSVQKYGVDPYLIYSIVMQESSLQHNSTLPGGKSFNGSAYGIAQIENTTFGSTIEAYNYETKEIDKIKITEYTASDLSTSLILCAMRMQGYMEKYNGNVYLAIQSYNYNSYLVDTAINLYAEEIGKSFDEVTSNFKDMGWIKYINDIHFHPKKYLSNWEYGTYGDNEYIHNVLGYYIGNNIVNQISDTEYLVYDMLSNDVTKLNIPTKNNTEFLKEKTDSTVKIRLRNN